MGTAGGHRKMKRKDLIFFAVIGLDGVGQIFDVYEIYKVTAHIFLICAVLVQRILRRCIASPQHGRRTLNIRIEAHRI